MVEPHHCTQCGAPDHNITTCPLAADRREGQCLAVTESYRQAGQEAKRRSGWGPSDLCRQGERRGLIGVPIFLARFVLDTVCMIMCVVSARHFVQVVGHGWYPINHTTVYASLVSMANDCRQKLVAHIAMYVDVAIVPYSSLHGFVDVRTRMHPDRATVLAVESQFSMFRAWGAMHHCEC